MYLTTQSTIQKGSRRMQAKAGVSTTEFLFWAPVAILLAWFAYDVNRRVEESQLVAIAARNATMLGKSTQTEALVDSTISENLQKSIFPLSAENRSAMTTSGSSPGMVIQSESGNVIAPEFLTHPDFMRESDQAGALSSYNATARATGNSTKLITGAMNTALTFGENIRILAKDEVRRGQVSLNIAGGGNLMDKSINLLLATTMGRKPEEVRVTGRSYIGRFTVRPESGYHNNDYRYSGYYGIGLGFTKPEWGSDSNDSDRQNSKKLQTRCMNRFFTRNDCDTKKNFFMEGAINFSDAFPKEIRNLAMARYALSVVLQALNVVSGGGTGVADVSISQAASYAVEEIGQAAMETISSTAIEAIKTSVTSMIPNPTMAQLGVFEASFKAISDEAINSIPMGNGMGGNSGL